jgi:hypothetical protein
MIGFCRDTLARSRVLCPSQFTCASTIAQIEHGPAQALPSVQVETMAQGAVERAHRLQRGTHPPSIHLPVSFPRLILINQQNYRAEVTEVDEMGRHAVRKRTLKSNRRKKDVRTDNVDAKCLFDFHFTTTRCKIDA